MKNTKPAIWFPTVKTNTGTDKFTEQLVTVLNQRGFQAEITWLPHRAEYLPWLVPAPPKPQWANITHINSWLVPKFIPRELPVVATVHLCVQDPIIRPYKSLVQHLYHKLWVTPIEQYVLNHAKAVTSVSLYTKNKVQNIFNINNVELIYNGIDVEKFKYKKSTSKNDTFKLLFAGTNSIRKGFDLLPLIMEELGCEYELVFTSNHPDSVNHLPTNMKAIPYCKSQAEMLDLYHSVDALIFPSRLEGFGLVVAEAMACGLPVVIADSSALTELVDHGTTGFLCERDNVDDFVQTIRNLKKHPELCIDVGKRAQDIAITRFNKDDMVEKYIDLYTRVLNHEDD